MGKLGKRPGKLPTESVSYLVEFAENEFRLARPLPNGQGTYRDELESFARQTGRTPFELRGHEMPLELAHVWGWFRELSAVRGSNGWGPNPISYREIEAWAGLTGALITAPEVQLIMQLDGLYIAAVEDAMEQKRVWIKQQQPGR